MNPRSADFQSISISGNCISWRDFSGVCGCAKRLKCVELAELAPALESPTTNESASKLDALHRLREVRLRLCRLCRAALYHRFPIGRATPLFAHRVVRKPRGQ